VKPSEAPSASGDDAVTHREEPRIPPTDGAAAPKITAVPAQDELCSILGKPESADELGRIGDYRVIRILGSGGMGVVFEAEDIHLKRRVAVKALLPALASSSTARDRFLREARAVAEIESDHVVSIFRVGEDRGIPFFAMQFLRGETLDDRVSKEQLPIPEILRISREMAMGLHAAHEKGLVHRDVKPANTWLEAGSGRVKILDFGLARGTGDSTHITREGAVIGTPAYMSPEQARGQPATYRSDLFSLGSVIYRMCAGKQPFKGNDTIDTLLQVASESPPAVRSINAGVPPALEGLIEQMLSKEPASRPVSAHAVAEEIRKIEAGAIGKKTGTAVPISDPTINLDPAPTRRERWPVIVAILFIIAGIGLFLATKSFLSRTSAQDGSGDRSQSESPIIASPLDDLDPDNVPAANRVPALGRSLVAVLKGTNPSSVQSVEFNRDGTLVASVGLRGDGHVWDVIAGKERTALTCRRLIFTPGGQTFVSVGADGAHFRDLDGKSLFSVPAHADEEIFAVSFGPEGRVLAAGGSKLLRKSGRTEGFVRLYMNENKDMVEFPGIYHPVYAVVVSQDGNRLVAMESDRSVHAWDIASHKEIKLEDGRATKGSDTMPASRGSLMDLASDNRTLAFARRSVVYLVDLDTGKELRRLPALESQVHGLAFSPDGKQIAVSDGRGQVTLFDVNGDRLRGWQMPSVVNDVAFAPDGRYLAIANFNGTVSILRLTARGE
jgi:serine/threonine protein kinase